MTRSGLAQRVASKSGVADVRAELVVETVFECMRAAMLQGERIELRGFGTFRVNSYRAYQGRNPKTGDAVQVRPKRASHFKPGAPFRARLNSAKEGPRPSSVGSSPSSGQRAPLLRDPAGTDDPA